jgi:GTPase
MGFFTFHCFKIGNIEYKRQVHQATSARLRSLATQLSYRMDQGNGTCEYRLGVEDDGCHSLLDYPTIVESARILECISRTLNAVVVERRMIQNEVINDQDGNPIPVPDARTCPPVAIQEPCLLGDALGRPMSVEVNDVNSSQLQKEPGIYTRAVLRLTRIETHLLDPSPRSLQELSDATESLAVQKEQNSRSGDSTRIGDVAFKGDKYSEVKSLESFSIGETLSSRNIRVAVVGNVDAGKSTMIGTLTTSSLDDGRGKSRTMIMKHRHEIESGRTSTATTHLMGFRSSGEPIAGKDPLRAKRKSEDEVARESFRVITLMDLAGHEKYLKTT